MEVQEKELYKKDEGVNNLTEDLLEVLEFLVCMSEDSTGISGYHLNSDIAEWGEFEEIQLAIELIAKLKNR